MKLTLQQFVTTLFISHKEVYLCNGIVKDFILI